MFNINFLTTLCGLINVNGNVVDQGTYSRQKDRRKAKLRSGI